MVSELEMFDRYVDYENGMTGLDGVQHNPVQQCGQRSLEHIQ